MLLSDAQRQTGAWDIAHLKQKRENLHSDLDMHVFSMVLLDGDRPDFVSAVKEAAKNDEICGCFYISQTRILSLLTLSCRSWKR
jgi:hypothetical protein